MGISSSKERRQWCINAGGSESNKWEPQSKKSGKGQPLDVAARGYEEARHSQGLSETARNEKSLIVKNKNEKTYTVEEPNARHKQSSPPTEWPSLLSRLAVRADPTMQTGMLFSNLPRAVAVPREDGFDGTASIV